MKPLLFFLSFFVTATCVFAQATTQHDISIKFTPYKNCRVYLSGFHGAERITEDTAWLDVKSEGHFRNKRKLPAGVYVVSSPENKVMFEVLLDKEQHFGIVADTTDLSKISFPGSADNGQFKQYTKRANEAEKEINAAREQSMQTKDIDAHRRMRDLTKLVNNELSEYGDSLIQKYPGTITALYVAVRNQPQGPKGLTPKTKADTIAGGLYMKQHFWDKAPLNDDRLVHIPFFDRKLEMYMRGFVPPMADSEIVTTDYILSLARGGKEIYPYLLNKFTMRYMNAPPGHSKVFVHLYNNYYLKGDTALITDSFKNVIYKRAYALMTNDIGDFAPELNLTDTGGKKVSLYSIDAPYTFVVFWDPTCTHCKEQIPRLDSIYKAKWKAMGIRIYSVNFYAGLMKQMMKFAHDNNLSPDWIHTYQPDGEAMEQTKNGVAGYKQTYDVYETPTMYLLDREKRIIAKRMTIAQFDAILMSARKK